ncbi:hypothetical protein SVIOM74S_09750 [Streptomyces violarus]
MLTGCWSERLPSPALSAVPSTSAVPAQRRADGPLPSPGDFVALVRDRAVTVLAGLSKLLRFLGWLTRASIRIHHMRDRTNWLLAPGMVYLQVPQQVIRASVGLESWSTVPPANDAQWSGAEDVEVQLPGGELALETIDGGQKEVPLILPSPGLYRMRWQSISGSILLGAGITAHSRQ